MKKPIIIVSNIVIMVANVAFVVFYSNQESKIAFQRQVEHFANTTVTLESVTEKYLEGEQRLCDVWSKTFVERPMSLEEAAAFFRRSNFLPNTSAHFVYADTLTGLSTHPKLSIVPSEELHVDNENWLLIGVIAAGLLLIFLLDLSYIFYVNKQLQMAVKMLECRNERTYCKAGRYEAGY